MLFIIFVFVLLAMLFNINNRYLRHVYIVVIPTITLLLVYCIYKNNKLDNCNKNCGDDQKCLNGCNTYNCIKQCNNINCLNTCLNKENYYNTDLNPYKLSRENYYNTDLNPYKLN